MEFKQISIREQFNIGDLPVENNISHLTELIEQGFKIINFSCTHIPRQNTTMADLEDKPTLVFQICTYFLFKD